MWRSNPEPYFVIPVLCVRLKKCACSSDSLSDDNPGAGTGEKSIPITRANTVIRHLDLTIIAGIVLVFWLELGNSTMVTSREHRAIGGAKTYSPVSSLLWGSSDGTQFPHCMLSACEDDVVGKMIQSTLTDRQTLMLWFLAPDTATYPQVCGRPQGWRSVHWGIHIIWEQTVNATVR